MNETGPMEVAVTPPDSLVRYDAPIFVGLEPSVEGSNTKPKSDNNQTAKMEDMLNSMIPPREWTEESGVWMQHVSQEPASRLDIVTLQEKLDKALADRKARETGICPVRDQLYSQCFDEIIRQVVLDGPERGLLLMRTRDEIRMSIDAYKTLYQSSVTFGMKKQLRAEEGLPALEEKAAAMEQEKANLELELQELRSKFEMMEKKENERKLADEKRRKEELDFLKYQGQHLDSFLKQMNSSK